MDTNNIDIKQAELEITVIRKIMEDSRKAVYDTSIQGIFWTMVMAPAILLNYLMYVFRFGFQYVGLLWIGAVVIGIIGSIIIARKERRTVRVKTFAGKLLATIGVAIGAANVMFAFASAVAKAFDPLYIVPVDSVVMGMGFYVIGIIQQLKTLKMLSFIWWAGAIFFFVFPSIHCLLFLAVILILTVWLPKLEEKNKQQQLSL
jgi:magnesium-transporting ATPase (P-type)